MKRLVRYGVSVLALTAILVTGFVWAGAPHKVTICHNGNVISVARSAVPAHEAHGDCRTNGNPGEKCTCCGDTPPLVTGCSEACGIFRSGFCGRIEIDECGCFFRDLPGNPSEGEASSDCGG